MLRKLRYSIKIAGFMPQNQNYYRNSFTRYFCMRLILFHQVMKISFVMLKIMHYTQCRLLWGQPRRTDLLLVPLFIHCRLLSHVNWGMSHEYLWLLVVLVANANALKLSCELLKSFVSGQVSMFPFQKLFNFLLYSSCYLNDFYRHWQRLCSALL